MFCLVSSDRVKTPRFPSSCWCLFQSIFLKFQFSFFLREKKLLFDLEMITGAWSLPQSWSTSLMACFCTCPAAMVRSEVDVCVHGKVRGGCICARIRSEVDVCVHDTVRGGYLFPAAGWPVT